MGDCFTSEIIDITTTHVILPNDNPHMAITLELILALIYGWLVTITLELSRNTDDAPLFLSSLSGRFSPRLTLLTTNWLHKHFILTTESITYA